MRRRINQTPDFVVNKNYPFYYADSNITDDRVNKEKKIPEKDYVIMFCKRHLSIRLPEKCRLGRTVPFNEVQVLFDSGPLKMGPIVCPETSERNCHNPLCNNPGERSAHKF
jgi:hypothetical protein